MLPKNLIEEPGMLNTWESEYERPRKKGRLDAETKNMKELWKDYASLPLLWKSGTVSDEYAKNFIGQEAVIFVNPGSLRHPSNASNQSYKQKPQAFWNLYTVYMSNILDLKISEASKGKTLIFHVKSNELNETKKIMTIPQNALLVPWDEKINQDIIRVDERVYADFLKNFISRSKLCGELWQDVERIQSILQKANIDTEIDNKCCFPPIYSDLIRQRK